MLNFAGNFKNDKRFAKTDWLCLCRQAKEDESHLCIIYGEIRRKYGKMENEDDLVKFFSEVLEERDRSGGLTAQLTFSSFEI